MAERKRPVAFHPLFFGLHAPLALYAANVALIPWQDVVRPVMVVTGSVALLWLVAGLLLRDALRGAAVASVLSYAFFSYSGMSQVWGAVFLGDLAGSNPRMPIALWGVITAAAVLIAGWKTKWNSAAATFLNIAGVLMVGMAAYASIAANITIKRAVEAATEKRSTIGAAAPLRNRPDVFYLVLDGYGRTDTFERLYGFSDSGLAKALEAEGFFVAHRSHSNYVQTELSLASSLNMAYLEDLIKPEGTAPTQRATLDHLIDDNEVARQLKKAGYRYVAITTGFPALQFSSADLRIERDYGQDLYESALLQKTPISFGSTHVISQFKARHDTLIGAFSTLERIAAPGVAPRFIFAHILAPHPPFVLRADLSFHKPNGPFGLFDGSHYVQNIGPAENYRRGYAEQAQAVGTLLLKTVRTIRQKSGGRAVIVIQGDHGPKANFDQDSVERTDLSEAFGILNAYLVPEKARAELREDVSPVNSFRLVLSAVLGADFAPLPNRSYYSTWEEPLKFVDVTDRLTP